MEQRAAGLLRAKGLRSTAQRRAVLSALDGHPHSTAAELESRIGVAAEASPAAGSLSRQGLYNVLDDLARARLIRCIEPAGSPTRYELRVGDNHHHLVCRSCGRIEDVDCTVGHAPCLTPENDRGFAVDEAEIIWWGVCASCRPARG
ncbi:Fur family transcriptional regulator [Streptomyces spectabilis]|uniref:Fur family ferric uptake transcriptional regulator n=1 Tax=Streptomyces spectabilis TaxID=68270 RepID=A0A5P2XKE3_STRST|nr:Fur family transcriptional regulator [Streptomyces spectabilis]MBB5102361.1 Fur family ferric uptake transcriptional regulator [Streptomyces spectabilis]MCI3907408.1 transcriptional repressor [Streptomyces spectabilis]QEV64124.1 transcriptional repressor [Streptomyces spectabilis]GGV30344.1 transcriptional repressor [Streptomyces spectabilis]